MYPLIFLFSLAAASVSAADGPPSRLPVPNEAAQQEARRLVTDLFKADYDRAKTSAQKIAHARNLLAEGTASRNDPAGKYALLLVASEIATQQGDLGLAMQVVDELALTFQVDGVELKLAAAEIALGTSRPTSASDESLAAAASVLDLAIVEDRFESAKKIISLAAAAARQSQDAEWIKHFAAQAKEISDLEKQFLKVREALAVLETEPRDPGANQTVGWYRCAVKGDFQGGILMLALGKSEQLSTLAQKQISAAPIPLDLADGWWQVARPSHYRAL